MKKLISIILVLTLLLSISVSAEEGTQTTLTEEEQYQKNLLIHSVIDPFRDRYGEDKHGDFFFDENGDVYLNVVMDLLTEDMQEDLEECNRILTANPLTAKGIQIVIHLCGTESI